LGRDSRDDDRTLYSTKSLSSGEIQGSVVQARDIQGGVHLHPHTVTLPVPSQLPAVGTIVNRENELAEIQAAWDGPSGAGSPKVALVSGPAGIGKSTVALHWAHEMRFRFPDGQLYADLRGNSTDEPVSPTEVLGLFVRALGIPPERIPGGLAELTGLYRSLAAGRKLIVLLDDARSAAQVRPLLPASSDSMAIVTSRFRLGGLLVGGARSVPLASLSVESSVDLLERMLGESRVTAEADAARSLVGLCARLPLAVCVAGARLATRPRWRLSEMVEALAHEQERLSTLSPGSGDDDEELTIRAPLNVSYRALHPAARRAYRLLGVYPAATFDEWTAAALCGCQRATARDLLSTLADANLLDDLPSGRYQFYDLTRLHAREVAMTESTDAEREESFLRLVEWTLRAVTSARDTIRPDDHDERSAAVPSGLFTDAAHALDWLDLEFGNLKATLQWAFSHGLFEETWRLVDAMWPLFLHRGHRSEGLEIDRLGLEAARAARNDEAEAKMLNRTGLTLRKLGDPEGAAADFRAALEIWTRLGNRYRMASSQRRLGFVEMDLGRFDTALELFSSALARFRELGEVRGAGLALYDIGKVLIMAGRPAEAVARLEEARRILAEVDDPYNHARTLILLGQAHPGDYEQAERLALTGLEEIRAIGSREGEARALEALAEIASTHGREDEARRYSREHRRVLDTMDADTGGSES
jgi:tetratricopeptide (TPR) repeat protein